MDNLSKAAREALARKDITDAKRASRLGRAGFRRADFDAIPGVGDVTLDEIGAWYRAETGSDWK